MTREKRGRPSSSNSDLQKQIDDVIAGRSASVEFSARTLENIAEVATELRQLRGLKSLVLKGSEISSLPAWLGDLPDLEKIDTRQNRQVPIPPWPGVRWGVDAERIVKGEVDVDKVYAVAIDPEISSEGIRYIFDLGEAGALRLTEFSIKKFIDVTENREKARANCSFADLVDSRIETFITSQRDLQVLELWGCPIYRIPEAISRLESITDLTLAGVWPENIPAWLFRLRGLTSLSLAGNGLSSLPDSIGEALKLKKLDLTLNSFTQIPDGIWKLASLEVLILRNCPIAEIPRDILHLKRLSSLILDDLFRDGTDDIGKVPQELASPPPEIASQGLEAIKRYWFQERDVGVDFLAEAKLLIVGEPGAGKTSLAKKIINPRYALDEDEDSTEGINVLTWHFPASVRVRDQNGERLVQRDFRVNIWDFGGQEIYHSTHQFFLTKRSVYILVTDERREDTDFEYWLEVVNLLSDGSPLVIVQNRKHGRQQGIDLGAIRQRYPNMCGVLVLDLADNTGLDEGTMKIRRELEQLPHIGSALPKTWRDVRVALEADPRNYISATEFFSICQAKGFTDREDMRQLGGYLHDLGICLFFQDDALLSRTVILKPEWGTSAVYRVLDDTAVAHALGVFCQDDLQRIWSDAVYETMQSELLQLMVKFGLCFRVPGSDTFIAPQLLTPSQPTYSWDEAENLVLRYEYDVMPKGVVRRLIVALHDLIVPGDYLWRNGAVFEYDSSRAEVIEQYRRRLLTIRIRGGDPRVLLGIIDRELTLIHRSYPGIRFEKLMPCNCAVCSALSEPNTFAVSELEDFARTGDRIQCRASRRLLDPLELLNTLWLDAGPSQPIGLEMKRSRETPHKPEVFISYKWGGAAEALAGEIQAKMEERGVIVTRDKSKMAYRDSIQQFMRGLGAGKCVIVILDNAYLESKSCMFELTEIANHLEFRSRIFPIVMRDARIFDAIDRIGYIKYWEDKQTELDRAMRQIGQENLQGIREELDLYETIRNTIARIIDVLADMNTLTPEIHRDTDFGQLYTDLAVALS